MLCNFAFRGRLCANGEIVRDIQSLRPLHYCLSQAGPCPWPSIINTGLPTIWIWTNSHFLLQINKTIRERQLYQAQNHHHHHELHVHHRCIAIIIIITNMIIIIMSVPTLNILQLDGCCNLWTWFIKNLLILILIIIIIIIVLKKTDWYV